MQYLESMIRRSLVIALHRVKIVSSEEPWTPKQLAVFNLVIAGLEDNSITLQIAASSLPKLGVDPNEPVTIIYRSKKSKTNGQELRS